MSTHAGAFFYDMRPVNRDLAIALSERVNGSKWDRAGHHLAPGLAVVHHLLEITQEDEREPLPLVSQSGDVLVWDGRLDNRQDLTFQLWRQLVDQDPTDAQLVMAAYNRWQHEAFERLIGDWSLALWDNTSRALTLASDYAGNRSLFFAVTNEAVHWSSSLEELVVRTDCAMDLDERFLIGFMSGNIPAGVTPYQSISSVPGGVAVKWSAATRSSQSRRLWEFPQERIKYRHERDYESCFRALFADAVRARLRSSHRVWAELSGGYDSSTIVCMADRLLGACTPARTPIDTVSYISEESPEADERRFIAAVAEQRGVASHYVIAEKAATTIDPQHDWVTPLFPTGTPLAMAQLVARHGGRVLMTGQAGDLVMANSPADPSAVIEALVDWQVLDAVRRAREWCIACQRPIYHLVRNASNQLVRRWRTEHLIRARFRSDTGGRGDLSELACDAYHLSPRAAEVWIHEARRRADVVQQANCAARAWLFAGLLEFTNLRQLESPPVNGLVKTHPYLHRPLVEFMAMIPATVASRPAEPRRLMKRAISEVLPSRIARRFSKGYVDPLKTRRLRESIAALPTAVEELIVVQRGYIDGGRLRASVADVRAGGCRNIRNVETILRLENWLSRRQDPMGMKALRSSSQKGGESHVRDTAVGTCGRG